MVTYSPEDILLNSYKDKITTLGKRTQPDEVDFNAIGALPIYVPNPYQEIFIEKEDQIELNAALKELALATPDEKSEKIQKVRALLVEKITAAKEDITELVVSQLNDCSDDMIEKLSDVYKHIGRYASGKSQKHAAFEITKILSSITAEKGIAVLCELLAGTVITVGAGVGAVTLGPVGAAAGGQLSKMAIDKISTYVNENYFQDEKHTQLPTESLELLASNFGFSEDTSNLMSAYLWGRMKQTESQKKDTRNPKNIDEIKKKYDYFKDLFDEGILRANSAKIGTMINFLIAEKNQLEAFVKSKNDGKLIESTAQLSALKEKYPNVVAAYDDLEFINFMLNRIKIESEEAFNNPDFTNELDDILNPPVKIQLCVIPYRGKIDKYSIGPYLDEKRDAEFGQFVRQLEILYNRRLIATQHQKQEKRGSTVATSFIERKENKHGISLKNHDGSEIMIETSVVQPGSNNREAMIEINCLVPQNQERRKLAIESAQKLVDSFFYKGTELDPVNQYDYEKYMLSAATGLPKTKKSPILLTQKTQLQLTQARQVVTDTDTMSLNLFSIDLKDETFDTAELKNLLMLLKPPIDINIIENKGQAHISINLFKDEYNALLDKSEYLENFENIIKKLCLFICGYIMKRENKQRDIKFDMAIAPHQHDHKFYVKKHIKKVIEDLPADYHASWCNSRSKTEMSKRRKV